MDPRIFAASIGASPSTTIPGTANVDLQGLIPSLGPLQEEAFGDEVRGGALPLHRNPNAVKRQKTVRALQSDRTTITKIQQESIDWDSRSDPQAYHDQFSEAALDNGVSEEGLAQILPEVMKGFEAEYKQTFERQFADSTRNVISDRLFKPGQSENLLLERDSFVRVGGTPLKFNELTAEAIVQRAIDAGDDEMLQELEVDAGFGRSYASYLPTGLDVIQDSVREVALQRENQSALDQQEAIRSEATSQLFGHLNGEVDLDDLAPEVRVQVEDMAQPYNDIVDPLIKDSVVGAYANASQGALTQRDARRLLSNVLSRQVDIDIAENLTQMNSESFDAESGIVPPPMRDGLIVVRELQDSVTQAVDQVQARLQSNPAFIPLPPNPAVKNAISTLRSGMVARVLEGEDPLVLVQELRTELDNAVDADMKYIAETEQRYERFQFLKAKALVPAPQQPQQEIPNGKETSKETGTKAGSSSETGKPEG